MYVLVCVDSRAPCACLHVSYDVFYLFAHIYGLPDARPGCSVREWISWFICGMAKRTSANRDAKTAILL